MASPSCDAAIPCVLVISSRIIGAVMSVLPLPVAVIAHEISEFVVTASGLRMLKA